MSIKILKISEKPIDNLRKLDYDKSNSKKLRKEMREMSPVTEQVSKYVRSKGINLAKMSRDTGVSYMALYDSLANTERKRDLRDNEFLSICGFLDVDPRYFVDKPSEKATG